MNDPIPTWPDERLAKQIDTMEASNPGYRALIDERARREAKKAAEEAKEQKERHHRELLAATRRANR
ncbi:MAG: hypothetical protein ABSC18_18495, partial [Verrucomicrobiota bacterium]